MVADEAKVEPLLTAQSDARDWARVNDWSDRIGWPRFFELTGLPFTICRSPGVTSLARVAQEFELVDVYSDALTVYIRMP